MSRFYTDYINRLSWSNRLRRLAWKLAQALLFRPTPVILFGWRAWLVRRFGGDIALGARIYPTVSIWAPWNLKMAEGSTLADGVDCYSVDQISVGRDATVSHRAVLCTASHDLSDPGRKLTTRPIILGEASWVFAEAFIMPGVHVGEGAVVAARGVATKDVDDWTTVGGNPARPIGKRVLRRV
ncbi:MAG TPA: putative colanic acid biosynthesis acetyltransferase [Opitutaceae bacterium]|nr:putative colanic acid biosynthesis acetyltransferase [Opitutaceae bacterium]